MINKNTRTKIPGVAPLTHGYNAVRGHRTGSNNSGAEDLHYSNQVVRVYTTYQYEYILRIN